MAYVTQPSSPAWLQTVMGDFDAFLPDHANCERKASAMALSMVSRYADKHALVDAMLALAQEELAHFHAVYRLLQARGLGLVPETRDPYVGALRREVRQGTAQLLDQLLVAGVIEARGCERFALVAAALPAGELKDFYLDITRSEARHGGLFVRLARTYYAAQEVEARLRQLVDLESRLLDGLALRAALH